MQNNKQLRSKWKVLLVDDEPRARNVVRRMFSAFSEFEIVAESTDGYAAVSAVASHRPDLILLDVQMPELDGFGVLQRIVSEPPPIVVFLTAFDEYAIKAFEANALDYLLKPFDAERFGKMVRRVQSQLEKRTAGENLANSIFEVLKGIGASYQQRFVIRLRDRVLLINCSDVDWIEAEDNYVRLHVGTSSYLDRDRLSDVAGRLNPREFARIHRSVVVNVSRIQEVHTCDGEYQVLLKTGVRVPLTRTYRDEFFTKISNCEISH